MPRTTREIYVEVDLADFDDEDLIAELNQRHVEAPGLGRTEAEKLYYATRGDIWPAEARRTIADWLASIVGRAA